MTTKERIFHSITFEILLVMTIIPLGSLLGGHAGSDMLMISLIMSFIAMTWNYIYNIAFDRTFGSERITRGLGLRILHAIGFEAGLVFATIPILMWKLNIGFMEALILDIALVLYVLVFALTFNWAYDVLRHKIMTKRARATA